MQLLSMQYRHRIANGFDQIAGTDLLNSPCIADIQIGKQRDFFDPKPPYLSR